MQKLVTLSLAVMLICCAKAYGQADTIKNGAYRNNVDFSKNKPVYSSGFKFIKRYKEDIPGFYKVRSKKPRLKKKIMQYGIWAISDSNHLYLNAIRLGMANGYIRIDTLRHYSYFKGIPIISLSQESLMNSAGETFGLLGAVVSGMIVQGENEKNTNYILDINSSIVHLLNKEYLLKLLKPYDELLYSYTIEPKNGSLGVMLKYIGLINEQTEE